MNPKRSNVILGLGENMIEKLSHMPNSRLEPGVQQPERMWGIPMGMHLRIDAQGVEFLNQIVSTSVEPWYGTVHKQDRWHAFADMLQWRRILPQIRILIISQVKLPGFSMQLIFDYFTAPSLDFGVIEDFPDQASEQTFETWIIKFGNRTDRLLLVGFQQPLRTIQDFQLLA